MGTLSGRTLSGTAYTIPTADFQSTVTAGGEQYVVSFKVTASPTGGNTVHSVDVVRVLKAEFNAQYDKNVTANGNGGPTGTSPSLESGGGEGYNGSGERFVDGSNGKDAEGGPSAEGAGEKAKGLIGKDFEDYLTNKFGGNGSFSESGRDFDGGIENRWWEAKSGQYWDLLINNPSQFAKFKSDMGHRLKIAVENNATYELFSNTPIPQTVKEWLNKKGIPFTELLD